MRSYPPSEGIDAVPLSFPCRAKATAAVALATAAVAGAAVADAAAPARAGQVRAREWWLQAPHITRAWGHVQTGGYARFDSTSAASAVVAGRQP